ncbi:unnamed protein product [Phytomonas sp. EM1]|nr:unnamed protein product [Phytomonas sp. EM1]|eukprot:CCW60125.1 unnamed protein product [Phytomonas sp. isolate EM1]
MSCPEGEKVESFKRARASSGARADDPSTPLPIHEKLTHPAAYERTHVHHVYEKIAAHFSATRYRAWPRVRRFLESLPPHAMIADVGCGNGKYFACAQRRSVSLSSPSSPSASESIPTRRYVIGVDYSAALLLQAQRAVADPNVMGAPAASASVSSSAKGAKGEKKGKGSVVERQPWTDSIRCDARRSPLRGGLFDAVISIAVIHHYATGERRREAIRELLRLARSGGGWVLIYVWARGEAGEKEREGEEARTKEGEGGNDDKKTARRGDPHTGDALIPWEMHTRFRSDAEDEPRVFHRFYHLFAEGELRDLCLAAAAEAGMGVRVRESYFDKENWCILLEKD